MQLTTTDLNKELEWLYSLESKGIKLGLDRVEKLAAELNNPQNSFISIHIAGTNGKGTTAKLLYTILKKEGYSVGLYTSPHLIRFNERIIVNDKEISDEGILRLMDYIKNIINKKNIDTTFFEFTTLMAFLYFKEKNTDIAVIETGLGGRLDATNIINPLLTIITNISYDHQKYLGYKIKEIAFEKAGIIKNNTPVITFANGEALSVIKKISSERKAPLFDVNKDIKIKSKESTLKYQKAIITTKKNRYNIKTKLLGDYQLENIATAISACEIINKKIKIKKTSVINGIENIYWPARLEIIRNKPLIIIDGSHNIAGFKKLKEFIIKYIEKKYNKIILIIGISSDKDKKDMLKLISKKTDSIIFTQAKYKGTSINELMKITREYHNNIYGIKDVDSAINKALKTANKNDAIIITGSLYLAGEAKDYFNKNSL